MVIRKAQAWVGVEVFFPLTINQAVQQRASERSRY